jgi:ferritin
MEKPVLISDTLIEMFNQRIANEEASARLYLKMSVHLQDLGYFNAAKLWKKFSEEELEHADIARSYLLALDIKPQTRDIIVPVASFDHLDTVIEATLTHEYEVTKQCDELAKQCLLEFDMRAFTIAQKYLDIQIHELEEYHDMKNRLDLFGRDVVSLRLYDNELEKML